MKWLCLYEACFAKHMFRENWAEKVENYISNENSMGGISVEPNFELLLQADITELCNRTHPTRATNIWSMHCINYEQARHSITFWITRRYQVVVWRNKKKVMVSLILFVHCDPWLMRISRGIWLPMQREYTTPEGQR